MVSGISISVGGRNAGRSQKIGVLAGYSVRVNLIDPTRTATIRNAFEKQMVSRFKKLAQAVTEAVVTDDCFGLMNVNVSPGKGAFQFHTTQQKQEAFMRWLNQQVDAGILQTGYAPQLGSGAATPWTNLYIRDTYQRGVTRGRYELQKAGYPVTPLNKSGGIEAAMGLPMHVDRLGLAYSRAFNELKGVTTMMDTQISRVLAEGLANGEGARSLAKKMNYVIRGTGSDLAMTDTLGRFIPAERRARMIARTETIRAHHLATIQEYENWGAAGVKVRAEWETAGDARVCSKCSGMQGNEYSLEEIKGMIPAHPNCRCMALPVEVVPERKAPAGKSAEVPKVVQYSFDDINENDWKWFDESADLGLTEFENAGWVIRNVESRTEAMMVLNRCRGANLNLLQIDLDLQQVFKKNKWDVTSVKKTITPKPLEGFRFNYYVQVKVNGEVQSISLTREFYMHTKFVEHEYFKMNEVLQGKGTSKDIFKCFFKQYHIADFNYVVVHANIDVGGYTWAKYGFTMNGGFDEISEFVDEIMIYKKYSAHRDKARSIIRQFYEENDMDTPFPMNLLADVPEFKPVLLGSDWQGTLNLKDPIQKARAYDYMGLKYK